MIRRLWTDGAEKVSLTSDRAYGIAVGHESDWADYEIPGYGRLSPGRPIPLAGEPLNLTVSVANATYNGISNLGAGERLAELVVLEAPHELAAYCQGRAPKSYDKRFTAAATGAEFILPFQGRRHAAIHYDLGEAGSLRVYGRRFARDPGAVFEKVLMDTVAVAAAGTDVWHIGGTNDEESYDSLELYFDTTDLSAFTGYINVDVMGELGLR